VGDPQVEVKRLHGVVSAWPEIDVSFIGIGENGHLAFNDPPCDMTVSDAYLVVDLDEACLAAQASMSLSADFNLNVLGNRCNRMYL
jgi:glucosamine-6-phosphate deaminase